MPKTVLPIRCVTHANDPPNTDSSIKMSFLFKKFKAKHYNYRDKKYRYVCTYIMLQFCKNG